MRRTVRSFLGAVAVATLGQGAVGCDAGSVAGGAPLPSCAPPASAAPAASAEATGSPVDEAATIAFKRNGAEVRTLTLKRLLTTVRPVAVKVYDPYYNREKSFRAMPIERVLELGFAGHDGSLAGVEFLLRAADGYTVSLRGNRLLEGGAMIAFEDVEVPGWEPIGPQRANPAPFYLIWTKKEQVSLETHPRPWQLATIEIVRFEDAFPRTVPKGLPDDDPGWKGFAIYRDQCVHCHAINRQGGRVGPELNLPRSVVEYRPVDQIKAYIRNPLDFRYSAMPPHPTMTDEHLDAIVAYLQAMKTRKQDDPKP